MELCFIQWTNLRTEAQDTESQIILRDCSCCWKMWWIWLLTSQKPINNPPYLMVVVQSLSGGRPNPMDCSTPASLPFAIPWSLLKLMSIESVGDAILPSHPQSSPSPFAFSLSQHQGLFQWVGSLHQVAEVLELQLQHQSFQWIFRVNSFQDWLVWFPYSLSWDRLALFCFYHIWYTPEIWAAHQCCQISPQWNPVCPRTHLWLCPLTSSEATLGNCQGLKPDSQTQDSLSVPGSSFLTVAILPFPYTARFELAAHFCKNK